MHIIPQIGLALPAEDVALLEEYQPAIWYENGHPDDWITSYVIDDVNIENNLANVHTAANTIDICYANVLTQYDINGVQCKVLEYHYYYPRNRYGCLTHEHDWEWVYIVLGLDEDQEYHPYVACYSAHDDDNRESIEKLNYRFFPSAHGGSLWSMFSGPRPRVVLSSGKHVIALSRSNGNAFLGDLFQNGSGEPDAGYFMMIGWEDGYSCSPCADGPFYYGDVGLDYLCPSRRELIECAAPVSPPWIRDGLWNNSPLPEDFALPAGWGNPPGTTVVLPESRLVWVYPNPTRGLIHILGAGAQQIASVRVFDSGGRSCDFPWWRTSSDGSSVNLWGLRTGIWFVKIGDTHGGKEVHRVVVIR